MRLNILKAATVIIVMTASLNVFSQQDPKAEKARKKEVKAQNKLRLAKIDSASDFKKFKIETEAKIKDNKRQIIVLKNKKLNGSPEANSKYDKAVVALEKKNNELETKIDECDDTPTSGWQAFKRSINNSMEDLGCAMKNVGSCDK